MSPLRPRYAKIRRIVDALLADDGVTTPPINVERMVKDAGIQLRFGDLGDISGLIARSAAETVIGVNARQHPTRQRFTIAHEYGHFVLHEGISHHTDVDFRVNYRSKTSSDATDVEEMEANFFAASLLMPEGFLVADGAEHLLDDGEGVLRIAKRYKVSGHAMSLRLANIFNKYSPF